MLITKNDILDAIAKLPISVQSEIARTLTDRIQYQAKSLIRVGVRVSFRTKHGVDIEGIVLKVNGKSVKVLATKDRYGMETRGHVQWTVSPQLLTVL